jgi:hypothetical protein
MLDTRYAQLLVSIAIGDKALIPVPRVCSQAINAWACEKGFAQTEITAALAGTFGTFVRDPYTRLVSAWHLQFSEGGAYWSALSWHDFVRSLPGSVDIHVRPQVELVPNAAAIWRYETLERDWRFCCRWLGVEWSALKRVRMNSRPTEPVEYTDELREVVREFYREDFRAFGYRP